ncbi:MAG: hypothetical protein Q8Q62_18885, partial [Mesorhizobium sp.]|nr:hypothetical protein [Mesorhizobium sp.]
RRIMAFLGEDYTADCLEPIVAGRVNSSGEAKDDVLKELDSIADFPLLAEMQVWYAAAHDPEWRIDTADNARAALAKYATFKIPMPA